ncbi:MAG: hypothetical protein NZ518_12625, partial [Dehalococcoidia bacterium]|nr:hypothetical protein [Dehalococcoidia bacterium]
MDGRQLREGLSVAPFRLTTGAVIAAIVLGEEGRGREWAVVPVAGVEPGGRLEAAELGQTAAGRPKLIATEATEAVTSDAI